MNDLDAGLRDEIDLAFREAKQMLRDGDLQSAITAGEAAWARFPEPRFDWDVSQSYVHALATLYRDAGMYPQAIALMQSLLQSGRVESFEDGPYFVMGTIYFEMGDLENAKRFLGEANRISRGRCFRDEPVKYRDLIKKD